MTILEQLEEYFYNTPSKQIKEDWESLNEWSDIGPNLEDYLEEINERKKADEFLE